ncbi:MAG: secondary thiamine-phosphate synthase enzyme YjbQ [Endomicrobiia bacterium]
MKDLEIITEKIFLSTDGNIDIINITSYLSEIIAKKQIQDGILTVFVPGATGAVTTVEYEKELIKDTKEMFLEIIKENKTYHHNSTHFHGNATSHLRATIIGPSLTIPITDGKLHLGVWQEVVFIDFDNRPRDRELVVKIIGVKK